MRIAAVLTVVAVVTHEEIVAFRHGKHIGVVPEAVHVDVQDVVLAALGQSFDQAGFGAQTPGPDRPVFTARQVAHRALRFINLFKSPGGFLRNFGAVDEKHPVLHLDLVARQADQPLDEV